MFPLSLTNSYVKTLAILFAEKKRSSSVARFSAQLANFFSSMGCRQTGRSRDVGWPRGYDTLRPHHRPAMHATSAFHGSRNRREACFVVLPEHLFFRVLDVIPSSLSVVVR